MSSEGKFAKALFDGFANPAVRKRIADLNRPSYEIGDGTDVVLGDYVIIPLAFGGRRAGQWAEVIKLSDDGLGLRFDQKVGGITREFFEWQDLMGARATAAPRDRKRASVTPPTTNRPSI
ncbi:hypothetical protein [Rhizobium sp. MHM7A]|uniref:hypothetical protein n=1 Tax=Rhizobium sp. MHM7A TaxID=2583233 RepID=UPI001105EF0B|nr:hypothetical protein [Rhizobium sp. MHM7A]TLX16382.1 hypothetical protein FFR93_03350 [Rhizobium sp. MHM7A]